MTSCSFNDFIATKFNGVLLATMADEPHRYPSIFSQRAIAYSRKIPP
jgi:hypothetical protein